MTRARVRYFTDVPVRGSRRKGGTTSLLAIRISELSRYLSHRHGETLSDDDAGRDDAFVMANHLVHTKGADRAVRSWLNLRAPWMAQDDVDELAATAVRLRLRWTADKLAQRIGLDDATRTALRIKTIGATDVTADQRIERRRLAKIEYKRASRRAKATADPTY
jgi:hypothetical protein